MESPYLTRRRAEPWTDLVREPGFVLLWLLGLWVFRRVLFLGDVFYYRDIFFLNAGQLGFLADSLRSGHGLPLWNPLHQGGLPFVADVNNQPLYPTSYLALVFEPFRALSLAIFLHVMAAATATYGLARRLGTGHWAACLAAAAFAFCGPTLSHSNTPGRLFALCLLPVILWFWHEGLSTLRRGPWLVAALLAGVQVLAGAPDLDVITYLMLWIWGLALVRGPASIVDVGAAGFGLGMLKAGLAAVQVLPLAVLAGQSRRAAGMPVEEFGAHSVYPGRWPELWVPGFFGRDSLDPVDYWGRAAVDGAVPYVVSLTFGAVVLALAGLGALTEGRGRRALACVAGLFLVAAMGRYLPGFVWAYEQVPGIQLFRFPSKVVAGAVLPLALLAALGLDALWRGRGRAGFALFAGLLSGLSLVFVVGLALESTSPGLQSLLFRGPGGAVDGGLPILLGGSALVAGLAAWSVSRMRDSRRAAFFCLLLALIELGFAADTALHTADAEVVGAVPSVVPTLQELLDQDRKTPGRLFRARQDWPTDFAGEDRDPVGRHVWLKESLGGYQAARFGMPVIFHEDFHSLFAQRTINLAFMVHQQSWAERLPWLAMAGVSVIVADEPLDLPQLTLETTFEPRDGGPVYVYRFAEALERVHWVRHWRTVDEPKDAVRQMLLDDFDPRRHAVVENTPGDGDLPTPDGACEGESKVEIESWTRDRFVVQVTGPCRGLLVLSEIFDGGRRLTVDGEPAEQRRVGYAWSGVFVPPGESRVEVEYAPRSLRIGAALSASTVLVMVLLWSRGRRRRRGASSSKPTW